MRKLKAPIKKQGHKKPAARKNGVGAITKAKLVKAHGLESVVLPAGFKAGKEGAVWRKTEDGYLLTSRNEFDELLEFVENNPPPDSMLEKRPEQHDTQTRKWWYEG